MISIFYSVVCLLRAGLRLVFICLRGICGSFLTATLSVLGSDVSMIHFRACMGRFWWLFSSLNVWFPRVLIGPVAFIVSGAHRLFCSGSRAGTSVSYVSRGSAFWSIDSSGLHLRPMPLTPVVSSHSRDVAHWPTFSGVSAALPGPLVLLSGRTEVASLPQLLCGKATFCHGRWGK